MRTTLSLSLVLILALSGVVFAQDDAAPPPIKPEELDALTAPIALYPDSLLSQVFMATTYPADVAAAAEWSAANKDQEGDAAVKAVDGEQWDPSVKSLCAFPAVLAMMKEQPDWVQNMGDAFLAQPKDVMDSVQRLRKQAKDEGNLKSTEQQVVKEEPAAPAEATTTSTSTSTSTTIIIEPADPEVVYVPSYNPTVVYGSWAYPAYPPTYFPPPPYYYPGSAIVAGIGFATGVAIADSLWGDCDWGHGDIDIDIDNYNNVNIGNKINSDNKKWEHNGANRDGVPYKDSASRQKYSKDVPGATQRSDYRGRDSGATAGTSSRDAQRQAASSTFQQQTGVNPRDTSRTSPDQINRDLANRGQSASDLNRGGGNLGAGGSGTRPQTGNLGGGGAGTRDVSSGNLGGGGAGTRDMSAGTGSRAGASHSSSALSGVQRPAASHQSVSRGTSSAGGRSMGSHSGGGGRSGGGGGGRRR